MTYREPRPLPPGQNLVERLPVRTYGRVPELSREQWSLQVTGDTHDGSSLTIDWAMLSAMTHVELEADMHCVSKLTAQDVRWRGVPMRAIVEMCPPAPGIDHALVYGQHGYSASVTIADLTSPRTIVAVEMDDAPLPAERGGPARLVIPHLYSYKGPKWVREVTYLAFAERGFWEDRGYHLHGDAWRQERYSYQE